MRLFYRFLPALVIALFAGAISAPLLAAPEYQDEAGHTELNIVETAVAAGDFTTLVAAVQAAGLVETLQGEGPFTVFAPTDAAFAALPAGTVEALLQDPTGALKDILLFHVVSGEIKAVDVLNSIGGSVATVGGQSADLSVSETRVLLANAGFVATDIQTSNGIIHVIDAVMMPPAPAEPSPPSAEEPAPLPNIVEAAVGAGNFTTLVAAVEAAGLAETLQGDGPFTVFAPTDDAFAALPAGAVEGLLADPDKALRNVLLYHVLSGKVLASDVLALDNSAVTTTNGDYVVVRVNDGTVKINDATVIVTDIETSNGVIHVIDSVLTPPAREVTKPAPSNECATVYHVQRGDTLSKIAHRYGVDAHALARANGIINPNVIYRGQRLCIGH